MPDRLFSYLIAYYKIVTLFALAMCFVLLPYKSFDPMSEEGLEGMIMHDLYGSKSMPAAARPAFEFAFLLFDLLSVLSLATQYLVIRYALQKREKWAYWYMWGIGFFWPAGASLIAWHTGAHAYFVSVGIMGVLFFPPLLLLRKYFR